MRKSTICVILVVSLTKAQKSRNHFRGMTLLKKMEIYLFSKTDSVRLNLWEILCTYHDDVIKWKHFPRNWPFVREIHRSRWIPRTKASDAELCLSGPDFDVFFDLHPNKQLSKQAWG